MRNFQKRLKCACDDLGLRIYLDHAIELHDGQEIVVPALIPELGFENGMIIVSDFNEIIEIERVIKSSLPEIGYGYSCLSDFTDSYDKETSIDMFSDWGWNGSPKTKPTWMIRPKFYSIKP